ncbi:hypothetical protein LIA77_02440 [Sarocladium implicatum]|nr:hypothetical protein LIA77_02440 [Sarocladium implicatum]
MSPAAAAALATAARTAATRNSCNKQFLVSYLAFSFSYPVLVQHALFLVYRSLGRERDTETDTHHAFNLRHCGFFAKKRYKREQQRATQLYGRLVDKFHRHGGQPWATGGTAEALFSRGGGMSP